MVELGVTLGLIGGIFGIFYRNCMKVKNMIFNWWYIILKGWVNKKDESKLKAFRAWISYPLGYCIYCSTTWITIFIGIIYLSNLDIIYNWKDLTILFISAMGVQHLVVSIACRFLINKHPDLDNTVE